MNWSETEFERVARGTRLADRTLDACREVLVAGASPGAVAKQFHMFPAHVSRSVATLREHQAEMQAGAQTQIHNSATLRWAAELLARELMGEGTLCIDPGAGQSYEGQILAVQHGFAVQKIARYAALHDLGRLTVSPRIGSVLSIAYPLDGKQATMVDVAPVAKAAGSEVGR